MSEILKLVPQRDAELAMHPEQFRELGHALVDEIAAFLASIPERRVTPGESADTVRLALGSTAGLPEQGVDAETVLRDATRLLFAHSLHIGHPRFFGYITSSPAPIGVLGDMLAAAVNSNCGSWTLSPMATEIEAQTVRWLAELIGYSAGAGGLLVSGGNMANMAAFWAARTRADNSARERGVNAAGAQPLRVYASAETHTWIQKASDLGGLGTEAVRWIPTDDQLRMDVAALRDALDADIAAGARPMMVVGTAGSVSTGAVDPLPAIADMCGEHGVWFHVDGAYGGFAAAVPGTPDDLRGLALADSVAIDPHKWLYAPLEAGCVLVRDPQTLRAAFSYHPPYYHFGAEVTNFVDFGPQNSRGFRALKVWLALRQIGRSGYVRSISADIALAERLYRQVESTPDLQPLTLGLSIATFRYVPRRLRNRIGAADAEAYLNELNKELLDRIQTSGRAFVSNAVIRGTYALRACIVNFNTRAEDVDALPAIVVEIARDVEREMGPGPTL